MKVLLSGGKGQLGHDLCALLQQHKVEIDAPGSAQMNLLEPDSLVVRTAWLYGAHGHNFVKTILRLANSREEIGIVSDQQGTPTWTCDLAQALWVLMNRERSGIPCR